MSACIATMLGAALLLYSSSALRMISRNFSTNHSHDVARTSLERIMADLHGAASSFTLVAFDGVTYSDVTPAVSADQDSYTSQYVSARANGVRFLTSAGGPYKLLGDGSGISPVAATSTTLKFEFGVGGKLPYTPKIGDKLQLPLISREFDIVAIPTAPSLGNTQGTVTFSTPIGFTLYTSGTTPAGVTNPVTTAYFYKRVGYTVWNNQLRYHLVYPPAAASDTVIVRPNVTSPQPFGLLFPTSSSPLTDGRNLRVSLEAYDLSYSARLFQNGTTTIQAVIPSRTQPPPLASN